MVAISTLDLLKKGSNATAVAARQAARYIEHALRFHNVLSSDPSLAIQSGTNYKRGSGMRLQRAKETASVNSIVDRLAIPPMDGEDDLPKWVQAVFSCVAYFKKIMDAEEKEWDAQDNGYERERGPILYVGNPPVFVELEQGRAEPTPSARDGDANDGLDYMARAEGHVILQEAARFDLTLQVLRDDDVEVEASGLGGKKQRERRRARRRGGADSGRRRDRDAAKRIAAEPERQVRILLRRPGPTRETSPPDSHPLPLLPSSTSPVIPGPEINHPHLGHRPPPPVGAGVGGGAGAGSSGGGGVKSGKGHGKRSKNRDNEFVLLQRPHSFVRPLLPGQTQTGPAPNTPAISSSGGANDKLVLLQRPK